jgi:hypothetical protein
MTVILDEPRVQDEVRERLSRKVARAAAELDRIRPGWAGEINVEILNIASECKCILGQLFHGSFGEGFDWFNQNTDRQGATLWGGFFTNWNNDLMNELWAKEIEDRL